MKCKYEKAHNNTPLPLNPFAHSQLRAGTNAGESAFYLFFFEFEPPPPPPALALLAGGGVALAVVLPALELFFEDFEDVPFVCWDLMFFSGLFCFSEVN